MEKGPPADAMYYDKGVAIFVYFDPDPEKLKRIRKYVFNHPGYGLKVQDKKYLLTIPLKKG